MSSSHVKRLEMIEMRPPSKRPSEEGSHLGKNVENITERCRKARLMWFGHVKRRDQEYVERKTLEMVSPGIRRLKPKRRWMDNVNLDTRAIVTTKDEVHDRTGWSLGGEL